MTSCALAFLANDRYYQWTVGFLESVRARNARMPLYCIPYDADTAGIAALQRPFGFSMVDADFTALDAFADRLFPSRPPRRRNVRKFAALALPYDEVAYFDVDVVLSIDPARLFGHLRPGVLDVLYLSTSKGFAFHPSRLAEVAQRYPGVAEISTGAFIGSPHALSIETIMATVDDNFGLYQSLRQDGLFDQPVFNFVLAHAGISCAHIRDCDASLAGMAWSRNRRIDSVGNGPIAFRNNRLLELATGREVVAVHWAGGLKAAFDAFDPRRWQIAQFRSHYVKRGLQRIAQQAA